MSPGSTPRCCSPDAAPKAGIEVSIGSVGDCYDNAVCETFHASLKKEKIYRQSWPTRAAARTAIFGYIEGWYNPRRRHSTLGYLSPTEFERQHVELAQRRSRARFRTTDRSRRRRRAPQTGLQRVASRRSASISPPTARSLPRTPSSTPTGPAQAATDGGQGTNGNGWPLRPGSQGAISLIQTSTTTAKTCRPNRGRSTRAAIGCVPARHQFRRRRRGHHPASCSRRYRTDAVSHARPCNSGASRTAGRSRTGVDSTAPDTSRWRPVASHPAEGLARAAGKRRYAQSRRERSRRRRTGTRGEHRLRSKPVTATKASGARASCQMSAHQSP